MKKKAANTRRIAIPFRPKRCDDADLGVRSHFGTRERMNQATPARRWIGFVANRFTTGLLALSVMVCVLSSCGSNRSDDLLSAEERAWVVAHPWIRVGTASQFGPYEFFDSKGQLVGLSVDYIKRIERDTGLRFQYVPGTSFAITSQRFLAGEIDMMMSLHATPQRLQVQSFTRPYASVPAVLLRHRSATLTTNNLGPKEPYAVSQNYAAAQFMAERYPEHPQVGVSDDRALLRGLAAGEFGAAVADMASASYIIRAQAIATLRIAADVGFSYERAFAYRKDMPMLGRILEKGLANIKEAERQEIAARWIGLHDERLISRRNLAWLLGVGAAAILLTLGLVLWNRVLRREVTARTLDLQNELTERLRLQGVERARGG